MRDLKGGECNMLKRKVMLWILVLSTCCGVASGRVLFVDDFEKDEVGKEPSNWEHLDFASGNSQITIANDPQNAKNKVAKTTGIGLYITKVAGRENWSDYIWDFDWLWENDNFVGTIYRVEGAEAHYHDSRRTGAVDIKIYTRKDGVWAEIATGPYPNENNIWYRHRLVLKGAKHEIYLRKRSDETPPVDWHLQEKPVVETENDMFRKGPVGMMGITAGVSYFDNMVVVETIEDLRKLHAVNHRGRLTTTWGQIKNQESVSDQ